MTRNEWDGTVEFSVSAGLVPWLDPIDYVHAVTGRALDVNGNVVGTIGFKLVDTIAAINDGQSLGLVCDADSSILGHMHAALFDQHGEPHEELDLMPSWSNLLFLAAVDTLPSGAETTFRVQLVETAIRLFCPQGLAVACEEEFGLKMEEWQQLGFRRIANSSFVLRELATGNPYRRSDTEGAYICDACGEEIVIPIDVSQGTQQAFVEDCPVCCRANIIHVDIDNEGNAIVWAQPEQDYD